MAIAHEYGNLERPLTYRIDDLQGARRRQFLTLLKVKSSELMKALEATGSVYPGDRVESHSEEEQSGEKGEPTMQV